MPMLCLICDLVNNRLPRHIVYEDEHVIALLDIRPAATGHPLLVPRTHVARVEALTKEQAEALFSALYKLQTPIREAV